MNLNRDLLQNFSILLCNARSLKDKFDELNVIATTTNPTVIAVTETWLTPITTDAQINLNDMNIYRSDRFGKTGGGVAIWAKKSLEFSHCMFYKTHHSSMDFACIHSKKTKLILCAIYIPPIITAADKVKINDFMISHYDTHMLQDPNVNIIILGDFNTFDLNTISNNLNMINVVNKATRGSNILDKVLVCDSLHNDWISTDITHPLAGSDHNIVVVKLNIQHEKTFNDNEEIKVYDYRNSNLHDMYKCLNNHSWDPIFLNNDINAKVTSLTNTLLNLQSKIPYNTVKFTKKDKYWITPVLKDIINKRWSAYRNGNMILYNNYKVKVKTEIIKAKNIWFNKLQQSNKGLWKIVDNIEGKNNKTDNHFDILAENSGGMHIVAEKINNVFMSNFTKDQDINNILPIVHGLTLENSIPLFTEAEVLSTLKNCKLKKSFGPDNISSKLLILTSTHIAKPLAHIFNHSITTSTFPDSWKKALVTPIPKHPNPSYVDYRPISLLSIISKLFEKLILNKLKKQLLNNYGHLQFGFCPGESSTSAILWILNKATDILDNWRQESTIISLDFSKAFDKVSHSILLNKLIKMQLPNWFIKWLASYLTNRSQSTRIKNTISQEQEVLSGVAQGSILGPYLFALFISDLHTNKDSNALAKYADDCYIICQNAKTDNAQTNIDAEMLHVDEWCKQNKMILNMEKCHCMRLGYTKGKKLSSYNKSEDTIPHINEIKMLGLTVDCTLSFEKHIDIIVRKQAQRLHVLRVMSRANYNHKDLINIYYAYINSIATYASVAFVNIGNTQNYKLQQIHDRAHKLICGEICYNKDCKLQETIKQQRQKSAIKFLEKIEKNQESKINNLLPLKLSTTGKYAEVKRRTTWKCNSFFVFTPSLSNKVSNKISNNNKNQYNTHLS